MWGRQLLTASESASTGDTTKPSQRVNKSFEELQLWKRHLVATDKQLKGYVASTEREPLEAYWCSMQAHVSSCGHPERAPCQPAYRAIDCWIASDLSRLLCFNLMEKNSCFTYHCLEEYMMNDCGYLSLAKLI